MRILKTKIWYFCILIPGFLIACGDTTPKSEVNVYSYDPLSLEGSGERGAFAPDIARDTETNRLWITYTSLDTSSYYLPAAGSKGSIRLAYSDDNGATWQESDSVVQPAFEVLVGPLTETHPDTSIPANSKGTWQSSHSTLIYDSSSPEAERWKLLWVQYLNADNVIYFTNYGWIAMKQASSPMELASAPAVKLFGGYSLQPDNSNTDAPAYSPLGQEPAILLNEDIVHFSGNASLSELSTCSFTEPALHAANDAIYLATLCIDLGVSPNKTYISYFRCSSPCNMTDANSWVYLGRLLSPADFKGTITIDKLHSPSIAEKEGKTFLLITIDDLNSGGDKSGCRMYEFEDINSNNLRRINGQLVEIAQINGNAGTGEGRCAAIEGMDGGVLLSITLDTGTSKDHHIVKTHISF